MANILKSIFTKKDPIKIGHLSTLSGDYAYFGGYESEGIDLALEQINKKGGINGQKVVIVREDDRMDAALSKAVLGKLIDVENVQAVIGSPSSEVTLADAPIVDKNKVTLITALAGSIKISTSSKYVFRIFPQTNQEGEKLVKVARRQGHKEVAIIYINKSYGLELAKSVKREAPKSGIEILAMEGYKSDNTDFKDQLNRIKEKNPSALFLLGYPKDIGLILNQASELGLKCDFFAPDTFDDPSVLAVTGRVSEGIIYVTPDMELSPLFVENFKKKFKKEPNIYNALIYDALNLLILAIQKGGNDGTAIRDELLKIKDYEGASGIITFDENGDAINRPLNVKTIKDGKVIDFLQ